MMTIASIKMQQREGDQIYQCRRGFKVIAVGIHSGMVTVWMEVDDQAPLEKVPFRLQRVGDGLKADFAHVGTVVNGYSDAFHIYIPWEKIYG